MSRSTADATSRAREVAKALQMATWNATLYLTNEPEVCQALREASAFASNTLRGGGGLGLYDTRTHVAIPREPSEADVERVARAYIKLKVDDPDVTVDALIRAAIAALVQGGEREDV